MKMQCFRLQSLGKAIGMCLFFVLATSANAQRVGLKSNALYWAAMSPNLGAEFRVNRHLTLNAGYNFLASRSGLGNGAYPRPCAGAARRHRSNRSSGAGNAPR